MIKGLIYNTKTKEETKIYFTEEELLEIKKRKEMEDLGNTLTPSEEQIAEAEFELKLLEKLIDWGVVL